MIFDFGKKGKYEVKYCLKMFVLFESATGHNFEIRGLQETLILIWCAIKASNKDFDWSVEELMENLDEHPELVPMFQQFFEEKAAEQQQLLEKALASKKKVATKKTKN